MVTEIGVDLYNHSITGDKTMAITGSRADEHHIPCVLIANSSGGGIVGTLDSSYYKGCGLRQGIEREFVVINESNGNDSRPSDTED